MPNIYTIINACADETQSRTSGYLNLLGALIANEHDTEKLSHLQELYDRTAKLCAEAESVAAFCKRHLM